VVLEGQSSQRIDKEHLYYDLYKPSTTTGEGVTAHPKLIMLKAHIAQTDMAQRREAQRRYIALQSVKSWNIEKWLDEWVAVFNIMNTLETTWFDYEIGQQDFLKAAIETNEHWATWELIRREGQISYQ
jgi:hypothetical protein